MQKYPVSNYQSNSSASQRDIDISTSNSDEFVCTNFSRMAYERFHKGHPLMIYETCTQLPNLLKFPDSRKRKTFCLYVNYGQTHKIKDLFGEFYTKSTTTDIALHAASRKVVVYIAGVLQPIHVNKYFKLNINKGDGREEKITISCPELPVTIILEVFQFANTPSEVTQSVPEFTYDVGILEMMAYKSFIRVNLSDDEFKKSIRFISASYVETMGSNKVTRDSLSAITVLNYEGKELINSLITPRNRIKHFRTTTYQTVDAQLIGQWDEYDAHWSLRKALDKKILVGHKVYDIISRIGMFRDRLLGIRDLALAPIFEKMGVQKHELFKITAIAKHLGDHFMDRKTDLWTENMCHKIRNIYNEIKDRWIDHFTPQKVYAHSIALKAYPNLIERDEEASSVSSNELLIYEEPDLHEDTDIEIVSVIEPTPKDTGKRKQLKSEPTVGTLPIVADEDTEGTVDEDAEERQVLDKPISELGTKLQVTIDTNATERQVALIEKPMSKLGAVLHTVKSKVLKVTKKPTIQQQLRKSVKMAHTKKVDQPTTSNTKLSKPFLPPKLKRSFKLDGIKYFLTAMEYTTREHDTMLLKFRNEKLENVDADPPPDKRARTDDQ